MGLDNLRAHGVRVDLRWNSEGLGGPKGTGTPRKEKTSYHPDLSLTCHYPQFICGTQSIWMSRNLNGVMSIKKIENTLCCQLAVKAECLIGGGIPQLHGELELRGIF